MLFTQNLSDVIYLFILTFCIILASLLVIRLLTNNIITRNNKMYGYLLPFFILIGLWAFSKLYYPVEVFSPFFDYVLIGAVFILGMYCINNLIKYNKNIYLLLLGLITLIPLAALVMHQNSLAVKAGIILCLLTLVLFIFYIIFKSSYLTTNTSTKLLQILISIITIIILGTDILTTIFHPESTNFTIWFVLLGLLVLGYYTIEVDYIKTIDMYKNNLQAQEISYAESENMEDVIISLARTLDAKDKYTEGHVERVSQFAMFLGERVGLSTSQIETLRIAGLIHDIGKISINTNTLNKCGHLDEEELDEVRMHPIWGEQICRPLKALESTAKIIRSHHEKLDGSGYPDGLKADQISFETRIITIVDIFDALTTDRAYRKALTVKQAMDILKKEAAQGKLDSFLVNEFENLLIDANVIELNDV
ncbi:hypothetical protein SYNTR_0259 [Candidatus Syntrophocurvum alkaliphilum]|uniref:HD-GYP domain-containing protein n=2 Tax=Candidatus Syntrophocurvum alkaliphilum TaxID=2293317 RepID=A0A6I6DDG4_9FIRM|nr:hypothetical protein SYNTR_0259 [Candidatus Syntrophocurvum alkaliphilum]